MGVRFMLFLLALLTIAASASPAQDSDASFEARIVVYKVSPVYPDLAKRNRISGVVKLRATIAPNGSVRAVEPAGGNPVLLKAAQDAVGNWKFAPGPDETQELIELRFEPH
jgi:TonB family protein